MNKKKVSLIIGILLTVCFLGLIFAVKIGYTEGFDHAVANVLKRTESLTGVMKVVTSLGDSWFLVLVAILFIIFVHDKKDGVAAIVCLGGGAGLNHLLKNVVRRARPFANQLVSVSGFSFPSGHSTSSMVFYGFLIYLIYKKCNNKIVRNVSIISLGILILMIGLSRVYLGVHYISDVIGGFILGILYLIFYVNMYRTLWDKQ